jgi:hypothetical protein
VPVLTFVTEMPFGIMTDRRPHIRQVRSYQCETSFFGICAGKWVTVSRFLSCVACLVLGLTLVATTATPAQAAKGPVKTYRERVVGTIISTSQNVTSTAGRINGTPIARGTTSGMQSAGTTPPPCSVGSSPASGTSTLVAYDGDNLYSSFTGSVCESQSTSNSGTYTLTGTFTIDGGTGKFAGATGSGTTDSTLTLHATPQGSQGPFVSHSLGTITLAH